MHKDLLPDFLHLFHNFFNSPASVRRLLEAFDGDPRAVRAAGENNLDAVGCNDSTRAKIRRDRGRLVARDLAWAAEPDNHLVSYRDAAYPELLRHIDDSPAMLYVQGDPGLLDRAQIAVVGARHCTPGGAHNAEEFAAELAAAGFIVTSGLALGIDSAAHAGALRTGGGSIAVLGTGIDRIYPAANRRLADGIRRQGLLVSEFPPGTGPAPYHFPRRNRIISGLSLATLVVEAAARSGSLITARLAAEQGRDVFALPGSIHNPLSRGCHQLLRDGALLAENAQDILRELQPGLCWSRADSGDAAAVADRVDAEHGRLLGLIGYDPVTTDTLAERSGLTIDQLSSMLLVLELNDLIQSAPGGCFVRI